MRSGNEFPRARFRGLREAQQAASLLRSTACRTPSGIERRESESQVASRFPAGCRKLQAGRLCSREIVFALLAIALSLASCVAPDARHQVIISTQDQQLALLDRGKLMAIYPVSTSKFGLGDVPGSGYTPLGQLEIARKIGNGAPSGAVFKDRRRTGEIVLPDSPGRDPIVSRILWLRGREPQNVNAFSRMIYIHGTPEERNLGRPASYGCVRMRSSDVIQLYDIVGRGAQVSIVDAPLTSVVPIAAGETQIVSTGNGGIIVR